MDCCLLSAEEVGRLVHYRLLPNHEEHTHLDPKVAIKGVQDEELELVEHEGRYYVTRPKLHFLRALPSGPSKIKVTQRIISNHILALKPIR